MSTATPRRYFIDHDAAREEAIIRRVLVSPQPVKGPSADRSHASSKNAATLLGLGRLVRGRLIRRVR